MKRAARLLGASIVLFTILIVYAAARYPGGTWADHHTHGYDPLHNFLCDLFEPVALDGSPNATSSRASIAGVLALCAGLALTWWHLPALFPSERRLGRAVRALGIVSTAGIVAVPLAPAVAWYWSHAVVVLFAGAAGLGAAVTSVMGLARHERPLARLGALTIAVVIVDVVLFIHQLIVVGNPSIWLSLLEVVATVLVLVWLSLIARRWLVSAP